MPGRALKKNEGRLLKEFYAALYAHFGPQDWWPAKTRFEVIVGAILTQNTNWGNVERAIANLKKAGVLTPQKMRAIELTELAGLIRPAGYFNVKARRIGHFLEYLFDNYGSASSNLTRFLKKDTKTLRTELLSVNGIGPETADSIVLYAAQKAVFVVDAYTKRMFSRHGLVPEDADYAQIQGLFTANLKIDAILFNEYHALIVRTGKEFCKTKKPLCEQCPLGVFLTS